MLYLLNIAFDGVVTEPALLDVLRSWPGLNRQHGYPRTANNMVADKTRCVVSRMTHRYFAKIAVPETLYRTE